MNVLDFAIFQWIIQIPINQFSNFSCLEVQEISRGIIFRNLCSFKELSNEVNRKKCTRLKSFRKAYICTSKQSSNSFAIFNMNIFTHGKSPQQLWTSSYISSRFFLHNQEFQLTQLGWYETNESKQIDLQQNLRVALILPALKSISRWNELLRTVESR